MAPRRQRRRTPDLETNNPPDELRRQERPSASPDPPADTPSAYERELDRLDAATSTRH